MRFDHVDFAAFDAYILKRKHADDDYSDALMRQAFMCHQIRPPAENDALWHDMAGRMQMIFVKT